jgi:hypothetical protein
MIFALTLLLLADEPVPRLDLTLHPGMEPRPICRAPREAPSFYLGAIENGFALVPVDVVVRDLPELAPDGKPWQRIATVRYGLTFFLDPAREPRVRLPRGGGQVSVERGEDGVWRTVGEIPPMRLRLNHLEGRPPTLADATQHTHATRGRRHAAWHPLEGERWRAGFWAYVWLIDQSGEQHEILIKRAEAAPGVCVDVLEGGPSAEVHEGHAGE